MSDADYMNKVAGWARQYDATQRTPFDTMDEQRRREKALYALDGMVGTPVAPELSNLKTHLNQVLPLVEGLVKENAELRRQLDQSRGRLQQLEKFAHQYLDEIAGLADRPEREDGL